MSQLDDRLHSAFDQRAERAEGLVLSPQVVRAAARHQRNRARTTTAVVLALAVLPAAGFALGQRQHTTHAASRPVTPLPRGASAALPWAGTTDLSLRKADTGGVHGGWELCFGESCQDVASPGQHSVSLLQQATTVQGLAPVGTARVTVRTRDGQTVEAQLATSAASHLPGVLFGAPDVVVTRPEGTAFSLTYQVTAYDAAGAQLAVRTSVGGWDLAQQHPPAGAVLVLEDQGAAGPAVVTWVDRSGWVCIGERAGTGAAAMFGAFSCSPPTDPSTVVLVTDDVGDGSPLLRLPPSVGSVEVRDAAGHRVASASTHALGGWSLAVVDRRAEGSTPGSTVTALDRSGHVVAQVPTGSMHPLDGTVRADQ